MKIISFNVNGIRSAIRKGFIDWLKIAKPDMICLQEIKATEQNIDKNFLLEMGYHPFFLSAQKKGYSGVAVFSKIQPLKVNYGIEEIKLSLSEGRMLILEFENFHLINTYFPSGTTGDKRQDIKYQFLYDYAMWIGEYKKNHPNLVCLGDYNIAHTEIDIHNPISNKNSSGFLPEERQWMSSHLESGFIDTFRLHHPQKLDSYSWWSFRANARTNNKGWRIDYILCSDTIKDNVLDSDILSEVYFSDHCPISMDIAF